MFRSGRSCITCRNATKIMSLSHSQATLMHIHPSLRMKTSQVDRLLRLCGTLYSHFTRRNTTNHLLHILSTYSTNPFMLFKVQTSLVRNEFPSSSMFKFGLVYPRFTDNEREFEASISPQRRHLFSLGRSLYPQDHNLSKITDLIWLLIWGSFLSLISWSPTHYPRLPNVFPSFHLIPSMSTNSSHIRTQIKKINQILIKRHPKCTTTHPNHLYTTRIHHMILIKPSPAHQSSCTLKGVFTLLPSGYQS